MPIPSTKDAAINRRYGEDHLNYNIPKYRQSIKVYNRDTGDLYVQYYNCDLNEILAKLRRDHFIDRIKYKVVDDQGYVEYVG